MNSEKRTPVPDDADDAPDVELEWLYDDRADPSELTIFSPGERTLATEWITVDRSVARSLDSVR
ncbi:hypothetical protein [Halogeometricum luteum]|uniref:Uncharacterized protein n=1 Tax=Halogeometricum luteum TaxID=2950537 RepID=A0ABU2G797_9EURY|nr:hypothetical protein [Halogeometricum sp. S3BR5-2]MDS0296158.1 hypothetical protein [Halogeometricum sp. S3BR5-2]